MSLLFLLGLPALAPVGVGAWAYVRGSARSRLWLMLCAGALALGAALALAWCATLPDPALRLRWTLPAYGVAVMASALLLGMAAAFFWQRGRRLVRGMVIVALAVFIGAVGFENATLLLWGSEL